MPCSFHEFFHRDSFTTKNIKLKQVGIFAVDIFLVVVQISIDLSHPEIHMEKNLWSKASHHVGRLWLPFILHAWKDNGEFHRWNPRVEPLGLIGWCRHFEDPFETPPTQNTGFFHPKPWRRVQPGILRVTWNKSPAVFWGRFCLMNLILFFVPQKCFWQIPWAEHLKIGLFTYITLGMNWSTKQWV